MYIASKIFLLIFYFYMIFIMRKLHDGHRFLLHVLHMKNKLLFVIDLFTFLQKSHFIFDSSVNWVLLKSLKDKLCITWPFLHSYKIMLKSSIFILIGSLHLGHLINSDFLKLEYSFVFNTILLSEINTIIFFRFLSSLLAI